MVGDTYSIFCRAESRDEGQFGVLTGRTKRRSLRRQERTLSWPEAQNFAGGSSNPSANNQCKMFISLAMSIENEK